MCSRRRRSPIAFALGRRRAETIAKTEDPARPIVPDVVVGDYQEVVAIKLRKDVDPLRLKQPVEA